jgi:hypothetical protein
MQYAPANLKSHGERSTKNQESLKHRNTRFCCATCSYDQQTQCVCYCITEIVQRARQQGRRTTDYRRRDHHQEGGRVDYEDNDQDAALARVQRGDVNIALATTITHPRRFHIRREAVLFSKTSQTSAIGR